MLALCILFYRNKGAYIMQKGSKLANADSYINQKLEIGTLKKKAIQSGGVNVASAMVSFGIQTVGVVVLGRLLRPNDFGIVTMVMAICLLPMNFGTNGFTEYIIQTQKLEEEELNGIFWIHAIISIALTIAFIFAGPFLARFYREPQIGDIAAVLAFGIIVQMLSTVQLALLKKRMEFRKIALNNIIAGALSTALGIGLAIGGFGSWAVVIRNLSSVALITIGVWIACPWRPGSPKGLRKGTESLGFALRVYGNFTLSYFARSLDKVLLGRYHGSLFLGNYDRGYYLSSVPVEQLATPLHSIGLSTLGRLRSEPELFRSYFSKALRTLSFFGVFAAVICTVGGREIVRVLLGPGWEQAGIVVCAFGPGIAANIIYSMHSWLHLSLGRPDRWLRWSIAGLALTAGLIFCAAPYGPVYVAAAYSVSFYILLAPSLWYGGRPINLKLCPLLKCMAPYFAAGIVTVAIFLAGTELYAPTQGYFRRLVPIEKLIIATFISTTIYIGLVIIFHFGLDPLKEILSFIKMFITRERKTE